MKDYYAIYDTKTEKYYGIYWVSLGVAKTTMWFGSELVAQWFATKTAAKYTIKTNKDLKNNPNLCIKKVAEFFD